MNNTISKFYYLYISIRTVSTVFRRVHLTLNPRSVVRDPPVHPVVACQGALVAKADVPDENVLVSTLVGEGTTRVPLTAVLPLHPPGTDHPVRDDGAHGGTAGLLAHHRHLHLHEGVGEVSSPVRQRSPTCNSSLNNTVGKLGENNFIS